MKGNTRLIRREIVWTARIMKSMRARGKGAQGSEEKWHDRVER